MHGRRVKRILRPADAKEPGALLECLGAESLDLLEIFARTELAVLVAPLYYRLCERRAHAGDTLQQRRAGGVQLNSDPVHAAYDHFVELCAQKRLMHVVLVLSNADRLWIDLHQLGQRILQPAAYRNRTTHGQI